MLTRGGTLAERLIGAGPAKGAIRSAARVSTTLPDAVSPGETISALRGTPVVDQVEADLVDLTGVFSLLDRQEEGAVPRELAMDALQSCGVLPVELVAELVGEMAPELLDVRLFYDCIKRVVDAAGQEVHQHSVLDDAGASLPAPTIGAAMLGILDFVRKKVLREQDFWVARKAKSLAAAITRREEAARLQEMTSRQNLETQRVQLAQSQQTNEFNLAWSSNLKELERQAADAEEQLRARHQEECLALRRQMAAAPQKAYKFTKELLELKLQVQLLANQGRYDEAGRKKLKAERLEQWERMRLDNEHALQLAKRELQLHKRHEQALNTLRERIRRGRVEHKEHWLLGAQRMLQSHRNVLSELKSKHALEASRADVSVKLELGASRARASTARAKTHYADAMPRVDTGRPSHTRAGRDKRRTQSVAFAPF